MLSNAFSSKTRLHLGPEKTEFQNLFFYLPIKLFVITTFCLLGLIENIDGNVLQLQNISTRTKEDIAEIKLVNSYNKGKYVLFRGWYCVYY